MSKQLTIKQVEGKLDKLVQGVLADLELHDIARFYGWVEDDSGDSENVFNLTGMIDLWFDEVQLAGEYYSDKCCANKVTEVRVIDHVVSNIIQELFDQNRKYLAEKFIDKFGDVLDQPVIEAVERFEVDTDQGIRIDNDLLSELRGV